MAQQPRQNPQQPPPPKTVAISAVVQQIVGLEEAANSNLPSKIEKVAKEIEDLQAVANVLFAPTTLNAMQPMHRAQIELIKINPNPEASEVYKITGSKALGLSKVSIFRILKAAGLSWSRPRKLSRDSDVDYYCYSAKVWGPQPDGRLFVGEDTADWSFYKRMEANTQLAEKRLSYCETDEERKQYLPLEKWARKRTMEERAYAGERTATRALLRAARAVLSLKTAYLPQELAKPFIVVRTVPALDMKDPEVKRAYSHALISSMTSCYSTPRTEGDEHIQEAEFTVSPQTEYDDQAEEDATVVAADVEPDEEEQAQPTETTDAATGEVTKLPPAEEMTDEQKEAAALDAKLTDLARQMGRDEFKALLERHGVSKLKDASLDTKTLIYEEAASGQKSLF